MMPYVWLKRTAGIELKSLILEGNSRKSEVVSLKSDFRLQTSDFRLQTSDFRLQTTYLRENKLDFTRDQKL